MLMHVYTPRASVIPPQQHGRVPPIRRVRPELDRQRAIARIAHVETQRRWHAHRIIYPIEVETHGDMAGREIHRV